MSIVQTLTTSFKGQLPLAVHDFTTDTMKLALYLSTANLGADTTVYTTDGESTGAGYAAGGIVLTNATVLTYGTTVYIDFDDAAWAGVLTARGGLIYNYSKANKSVAVINFGADKTSVNTFTVQMPANTYTSALIRI
mgnify:CR=1 FL=1|tara:strand:+ start:129 stop:539 length:411 start_codon:yes stop_codon:yes gene_type:complete